MTQRILQLRFDNDPRNYLQITYLLSAFGKLPPPVLFASRNSVKSTFYLHWRKYLKDQVLTSAFPFYSHCPKPPPPVNKAHLPFHLFSGLVPQFRFLVEQIQSMSLEAYCSMVVSLFVSGCEILSVTLFCVHCISSTEPLISVKIYMVIVLCPMAVWKHFGVKSQSWRSGKVIYVAWIQFSGWYT